MRRVKRKNHYNMGKLRKTRNGFRYKRNTSSKYIPFLIMSDTYTSTCEECGNEYDQNEFEKNKNICELCNDSENTEDNNI